MDEYIRPMIQRDGGDAEIVDIKESVVYVQLGGACAGCAGSNQTIKMMVGVGLGWSVLPRSMLDDELVPLKIRGMKLARQLGIVRHQSRTLSNAASAMIRTLQSQK